MNYELLSMNKKNIDKLAYILLFFGLSLGAISIYTFRFSSTRQFVVIMFLIAFYLTWGFVYHHLRGNATKRLMIEYLIIGAIAALTSFFVFFS